LNRVGFTTVAPPRHRYRTSPVTSRRVFGSGGCGLSGGDGGLTVAGRDQLTGDFVPLRGVHCGFRPVLGQIVHGGVRTDLLGPRRASAGVPISGKSAIDVEQPPAGSAAAATLRWQLPI